MSRFQPVAALRAAKRKRAILNEHRASPLDSSLRVIHLDCCVAREPLPDLSEPFDFGSSFCGASCALVLTRISVIFSLSRTALHLDMAHLLFFMYRSRIGTHCVAYPKRSFSGRHLRLCLLLLWD